MTSLSIIIPEYNEPSHIMPMLNQIGNLVIPDDIDIEVVFVSSSQCIPQIQKEFDFAIKFVTGIQGSGTARNKGASEASGDILLFSDCHCCFSDISSLLKLLSMNPDAIVAPGICPCNFPECELRGSTGYGGYLTPDYKWHWIHKDKKSKQNYFKVPFCATYFMLMQKQTFDDSIFGFISTEGVGGIEEEICMRLCRLGHPTLIDSRCSVGHRFLKSYPKGSSKGGFIKSRAIATVLSVFDETLYTEINEQMQKLGGKQWEETMKNAHIKFDDARKNIRKRQVKDIDERWFFR